MALLIVARIAGVSRARRIASLRSELLGKLLAWVDISTNEDEVAHLLSVDPALSIDVLIELFENVRGEGQERLAALANRIGLVSRIHRILRKGRARDRLIAAETLLWFPGPDTIAALRAAAHDRDVEVSLAAATSLIELTSEVPLEDLLAGRFDQTKSSRRLEGLLGRVAEKTPERLLRIAEDETRTVRVRSAALEALAQASAAPFLDRVTALAGSPALEVRAAAARFLGAIGHPGSEKTVRRLLADPDWQVRVRAAEAAARLGLLTLWPQLALLVDDNNWWVRLRSAEALAELGEGGIAALRAIVVNEARAASSQTAALVLAERRSTP